MNLAQLGRDAMNNLLLCILGHIPSCPRADVSETVPLVHAKLADSHLDIQAIVVVDANVAPAKMFPEHVLVDLLTALNLGNQLPSRLGVISHEPLIPLVLVRIIAPWSSPCSDTDKHSNLSPWPLVDNRLVQSLGSRVEGAGALVMEDSLAYLDWFEGQSNSTGCATSFPDLAVELGRWFASRIIRTEEGWGCTSRGAFIYSSNCTIGR